MGAEPIPRLLLSPEEAADALKIGRTRVYALIASGDLRSVLIGRSRRIPVTAVVEFVKRLEDAGRTMDTASSDHRGERDRVGETPADGHILEPRAS